MEREVDITRLGIVFRYHWNSSNCLQRTFTWRVLRNCFDLTKIKVKNLLAVSAGCELSPGIAWQKLTGSEGTLAHSYYDDNSYYVNIDTAKQLSVIFFFKENKIQTFGK